MTKSNLEIDEFGNKRWKNKKEQLHNENGPALIYSKYNIIRWYYHNQHHRIDGPADNSGNGDKRWFLKDEFIRKFEYD